MLLNISAIAHNGPAIWGGCVTRRQHRAESWYPAPAGQKIVTVQGGYGTCFCRHGTKFVALRRGRGTRLLSGREFLPVQKFDKWALAQCRDASCLGCRKLSWCRMFIGCSCANPGTRALQICLGSRNKSKNRDKQLTHIVRVRFS